MLVGAAAALAACGGGDSDSGQADTTASAPETGCTDIEELEVPSFGKHLDKDFTAADYETNPPTGGDHNPTPLRAATFYDDAKNPVPLGQAVHLLEHGAVIGWTNGLSKSDLSAVENEFNDVFKDGYYQLATVENPELDVPFALSAWGAMQKCATDDPSVIRPFVEAWYASPKSGESSRACEGAAQARQLLSARQPSHARRRPPVDICPVSCGKCRRARVRAPARARRAPSRGTA